MITMPETLVDAAKKAGMKVPPDLREYDTAEYPYWHLFCIVQLDRPVKEDSGAYSSVDFNARLIADIPADKIQLTKYGDIADDVI